ncbi:MAG: hypothetical protein Q7K03_11295 [Dehalococcoidia bacterium]|nr:hypothetical protein [Dehalococcoidia bacterium]
MSLQQSEVRDVAQARQQAAAAIEKQVGSTRELYDYNRALVEAFWPDISEFHVAWMARVASDLGLDILLGEVIWYQGRPYVTIKGLTRLLNRHPQFDNFELEPASADLRAAMRVAREEEQVWVCRLFRKDRTRPAIGYGRATPEDTFVGYGLIKKEDSPDQEPPSSAGSGQAFRTPAVVEMAQERAIRHAAQSAFAWEFMSTLDEPSSKEHRRVDPGDGQVSAVLEDGSPNTVGCTAAQRRCIHALARAVGLPDGRVDEEKGEVLEEGWRADLYRLYGVISTMQLTVAQAKEFIDSLTMEHQELDEPQNAQEVERRELWHRIEDLMKKLPKDTPKHVCSWFQREHGVEVKPEELKRFHPPGRIPTLALRRLVQGLEGYLMKLGPEGGP